MAYTDNKTLQTRIQLKYDSLSAWNSCDKKLLKGEIAIAYIPSDGTSLPDGTVAKPQLLMKVGDGESTFSQLNYVSGYAADVYNWAKAPNKPTYTAGEINGLLEYIEEHSDIDSDTQYQLVKVEGSEYNYKLQSKPLNGEWADVASSVIDLSGLAGRVKALEDASAATDKALADYKAEVPGIIDAAIDAAIGELDATVSQEAKKDNGYLALSVAEEDGKLTSVSGSVNVASIKADLVDGLDAEFTKAAGTDGLAYSLTQEDGKITGFSASIADGTYEKAGTVNAAIGALNSVNTTELKTGSEIDVVTSVTEAAGIVTVNTSKLAFQGEYSASNPVATKEYVDGHVEDILGDIAGGMHFIGKLDSKPADNAEGYEAGDVIVVGNIEYVFGKDGVWIELGDISQAQQMIDASLEAALGLLDHESTGSVSKTVTGITQVDGKITSVTYGDIKIASDAVTHGDSTVKASLEDHETRVKAVEDAVKNSSDNFNANVGTLITTAIEALDDQVEAQVASADNGWVSADLTQVDGVVTGLTVSVDASKYEVAGAAAAVQGATTSTVKDAMDAAAGAKAYAEEQIGAINTAIGAMDGSAVATSAEENTGIAYVLTGVEQADGIISKKSEIAVSKVGQTGKVQDLIQDNNTYIIFNCGDASTNI